MLYIIQIRRYFLKYDQLLIRIIDFYDILISYTIQLIKKTLTSSPQDFSIFINSLWYNRCSDVSLMFLL